MIGLVHAFVLALLVAALAGVSGAHFNPAVTVALVATRKFRGGDAAVYILMQLAGATLAALVAKGLLLDEGEVRQLGRHARRQRVLPRATGRASGPRASARSC